MKQILKHVANLYTLIGLLLLVSPIFYLSYTGFLQQNKVSASYQPQKETEIISQGIKGEELQFAGNKDATKALPTVTRSDKQYLQIPKIGVDTQIYEGDESALDKGVWRMPEKGRPYDDGETTVLAAHRWGLESLTNEYRSKHLFYRLPELRPGDEIIINWDNTEYKYRVTSIEETENVTKLTDLILITCKYFDSPIRVFVYAQKV